MATVRTAKTDWDGDLVSGTGLVHFASSGRPDAEVTWAARSQDANGKTSPEELIAAAHSSCFSMALSAGLAKAGTPPQRLETTAEVSFDPAAGGITKIHLTVRGEVPGISAEDFNTAAAEAKANCPVSQALAAVDDISPAATARSFVSPGIDPCQAAGWACPKGLRDMHHGTETLRQLC